MLCFKKKKETYGKFGGGLSQPGGPTTRLQIGPDTFPGSVTKLRELALTGHDYGVDLLFRLFRDRHKTVQVLVHKQSDKHLNLKK